MFVSTLVAFFLAEIGDKTQIATVGLAVRFEQFSPVVVGTTHGMMLANVPAVLAGNAGETVPVIIDRLTGKARPAQIFVAVLAASNFTYAEASWTQALADWIGAHTRAFEAIGGVPNLLVPDKALPSQSYAFAEWRLRRVGIDYHVKVQYRDHQKLNRR